MSWMENCREGVVRDVDGGDDDNNDDDYMMIIMMMVMVMVMKMMLYCRDDLAMLLWSLKSKLDVEWQSMC